MATAKKITSRPTKSIHRPEYQAVIEVLKSLRERTGLTQTQFAEVLGRNQTYVSTAERGAKLDTLQIRDWCIACGTDLIGWATEIESAISAARKLVVAILLTLVLAGCTTTVGSPYDATQTARFIVHQTTINDAIATMGTPQERQTLNDGSVRLLYYYFVASDDAAHPKSQGTYIYFDGAGTYLRTETSRLTDRNACSASASPADRQAHCPPWLGAVSRRLISAG